MTSSASTRRRPLRFGYFLVPNADQPLLETAARVEQQLERFAQEVVPALRDRPASSST